MRTNNRQLSIRTILLLTAVAVLLGALGALYCLKKATDASPSINHGDVVDGTGQFTH